MRRLLYIIIGVIALCVVSTGCENKALNRQLDDLDTLMRVSPDSVYAVLDSMDTHQMSKRQRMRHALLLADAQNKAYIDFTTDSAMIAVADYYDHHGTPNEQMRAHYLLGCTYRDMGDAPRALEAFHDADNNKDTSSTNCDYRLLMLIHSQASAIYKNQHLYDKELEEALIAEKYAWISKDTLSALLFSEKAIKVLQLNGNYKQSIANAKDLYDKYLSFGLRDEANISCHLITNGYLALKDYNIAQKYLELYEASLSDNTDRIVSGEAAYWVMKGQVCLGKKEYTTAEKCYRKALSFGKLSQSNLPIIYQDLCTIFTQTNAKDSVVKYNNYFAEAKKAEYDNLQAVACSQSKDLYNYIAERNIAEKERATAKRNKSIVWILCLVIIIIAIVGMHLRYRTIKRHELKVKSLQLDYQRTCEELMIADNKLRNAIMSKVHSDDIIAEKIQEIDKLKDKIKGIERTLTNITTGKKEIDIRYTHIVKHLYAYLDNPKISHVTPDDLKSLRTTVENICINFRSIINPLNILTEREYNICLLVKCGFSPTEIDTILSMPPNTTSTMRKRLLKKIFNETGKASDFDKRVSLIE